MKADTVVVRPARDEDLDRAAEIARAAWVRIHESFRKILGEELYAVLSPDWANRKEDAIRQFWRDHPEGMFVAERDGRVLAFITVRMDKRTRIGTIGNNAVDPAAQGQGIGTRMYEHILDHFRRHGMKYACVHTGLDEGHAPARRAYEKAGFDIAKPDVTYYTYL